MEKKIYRIISIILLIIISLAVFTPYVHAGITDDAKAFIDRGQTGTVYDNMSGKIDSKAGELSGLLYVIGTFIAIIATIILGIKYMTASSSENKAAIKKSAIVVGIGVFVLFASVTIWRIVVSSLSQAT